MRPFLHLQVLWKAVEQIPSEGFVVTKWYLHVCVYICVCLSDTAEDCLRVEPLNETKTHPIIIDRLASLLWGQSHFSVWICVRVSPNEHAVYVCVCLCLNVFVNGSFFCEPLYLSISSSVWSCLSKRVFIAGDRNHQSGFSPSCPCLTTLHVWVCVCVCVCHLATTEAV